MLSSLASAGSRWALQPRHLRKGGGAHSDALAQRDTHGRTDPLSQKLKADWSACYRLRSIQTSAKHRTIGSQAWLRLLALPSCLASFWDGLSRACSFPLTTWVQPFSSPLWHCWQALPTLEAFPYFAAPSAGQSAQGMAQCSQICPFLTRSAFGRCLSYRWMTQPLCAEVQCIVVSKARKPVASYQWCRWIDSWQAQVYGSWESISSLSKLSKGWTHCRLLGWSLTFHKSMPSSDWCHLRLCADERPRRCARCVSWPFYEAEPPLCPISQTYSHHMLALTAWTEGCQGRWCRCHEQWSSTQASQKSLRA